MVTEIKNVLLIGLGLIGGSLALALKKADPSITIVGADIDSNTIKSAIAKKIIDESVENSNLASVINNSSAEIDLIVLCIPVEAYPSYFEMIEACKYKGIITDVGSTKAAGIKYANQTLTKKAKFIPGHPMAGSESFGIDAAREDLFQGAYWILTPADDTDNNSLGELHGLLTAIGARVISVDPKEHDRVVAIVSHVPHIAASALVTLAKDHSGKDGELLRLAASGFKDTTRVAAGNPELWTGILMDNSEIIADALSELSEIISNTEKALREKDRDKISDMLNGAAETRRMLPAKWVPESAELIEVRIPMGNRPGIIAEITAIAGKTACNIQAIEIDHQTEARAVLQLTLTNEGNIESFTDKLSEAGFNPHIQKL